MVNVPNKSQRASLRGLPYQLYSWVSILTQQFVASVDLVSGRASERVPPAFLIRLGRRTYAAVFNFIAGCDPAYDHVGPVVDVSPEPFHGLILSLLYRFKDVLIQQFVPHYAIVAVDIDTLQRLDWRDISRQCRVFRPIASAGH